MSDFFEALFKFFSEFTWRKLAGVFLVLIVCFGGFSLYERYTSSFKLSRLQKATELLLRIQEAQANAPTNAPPELDRARNALLAQALKAIEETPMTFEVLPSKLSFSVDTPLKFFAGG